MVGSHDLLERLERYAILNKHRVVAISIIANIFTLRGKRKKMEGVSYTRSMESVTSKIKPMHHI